METIFTVIRYDERVANRIITKYFENKSISLQTVINACKNNGYKMIVITKDVILVKTESEFYADGCKKYRDWTFFTQEAWDDILAEEAEEA